MISFLLFLSLLGGVQAAHAYDVTALAIAIPIEISADLTVILVSPTATTSAALDGDAAKVAYATELSNDAAEEIAYDGAPSVVLEDAIQQIRAQTGTTLSDTDLALAIVRSIN